MSCMVLDEATRELLEQQIDDAIQLVATLVPIYRNPDVKSELHFEDEETFILGFISGDIIGSFTTKFISQFKRPAITGEILQAITILISSAREIREAIFKTG